MNIVNRQVSELIPYANNAKQATLESTGQTFEDVKADRDCQNPVNKSA